MPFKSLSECILSIHLVITIEDNIITIQLSQLQNFFIVDKDRRYWVISHNNREESN